MSTSQEPPAETESVQCTQWCKAMLGQVQRTYSPTLADTASVFVAFDRNRREQAKAENPPDIMTEARSVCHSLSVWGLSRVKDAEDPMVKRSMSLFLTKMEEAALHLMNAAGYASSEERERKASVVSAPKPAEPTRPAESTRPAQSTKSTKFAPTGGVATQTPPAAFSEDVQPEKPDTPKK